MTDFEVTVCLLPVSMASNTICSAAANCVSSKRKGKFTFRFFSLKVPDPPSAFSVGTESRPAERQRGANCGANVMVGC